MSSARAEPRSNKSPGQAYCNALLFGVGLYSYTLDLSVPQLFLATVQYRQRYRVTILEAADGFDT